MPSNALSQKKFGAKTPGVCHPPPPPPPWPPIDFQKFKWRQWLHIEYSQALISYSFAEMINMTRYADNVWHSRTAEFPTTPCAFTEFRIMFTPLRFIVICKYYPVDISYPIDLYWLNKRFYDAKRWDTGELMKKWGLAKHTIHCRIQQQPP